MDHPGVLLMQQECYCTSILKAIDSVQLLLSTKIKIKRDVTSERYLHAPCPARHLDQWSQNITRRKESTQLIRQTIQKREPPESLLSGPSEKHRIVKKLLVRILLQLQSGRG